MKTFFTLTLLVFLVGCTAEAPSDVTPTTPDTLQQEQVETTSDTDALIDNLLNDVNEVITDENALNSEETNQDVDTAEESTDEDMIELSTTYTNPAMEVVMNIEYDVDAEGKITEILVSSPNYQGMPQFNEGIQPVIGMSVSEASEYVVAGSSLTTPAFQDALKETL